MKGPAVRTVSNDDNLLLWPLGQPLASFLGSFLDGLCVGAPFACLFVPSWLEEGEIDRVFGELVGQLGGGRASVTGEVGGFLQFWQGNNREALRPDVVLEAVQGGVERPSYGRRDDEVDALVMREPLLQLSTLLLPQRREVGVVDLGVGCTQVVQPLGVADEVEFWCHC